MRLLWGIYADHLKAEEDRSQVHRAPDEEADGLLELLCGKALGRGLLKRIAY